MSSDWRCAASLAGLHQHRARHDLGDPRAQLGARHARPRPPPRSGRTCRLLSVIRWASGSVSCAIPAPPKEAVAELGQADDLVRATASSPAMWSVSPTSRFAAVGGVRVERGLVGGPRRAALHVVERLEALGQVGRDEVGGELVADRVALLVHEAAEREDRTRRPRPRRPPGGRGRAGRREGGRAGVVLLDVRLRRDGHVGALQRLAEDLVERVVDRVREDVGAGHQRDAEEDGEPGDEGPQLARGESSERDLVMAGMESAARRASGHALHELDHLGRGARQRASWTILPSRRTMSRSA